MGESKTHPDLSDMMSEIKGMEVLKSILPKKNTKKQPFTEPLFLSIVLQVLARVHTIQLFFGIVSPHENLDSHECKLL